MPQSAKVHPLRTRPSVAKIVLPGRTYDRDFSAVAPNLSGEVRMSRRGRLCGSHQVRRGHLFRGFKDTPLEIEYPAVRHDGRPLNAPSLGRVSTFTNDD